MTDEIEFSIMGDNAAGIQPLLDRFESEHPIHIRLRVLSWDTAWSDLVKVALYSDGPDVSEIGSTWLGDLVAMNAVRSFEPNEIAALGKVSNYLQGGRLIGGGSQTWAVPWLTGVRLLYFRRELLERAGIDERTAFQTAEQLDRTLAQLQAAGVAVPWTFPTGLTHTTLLNITSWVWGAGGDFITADGKRVLFSQPEARAGIRAYFALGRFLAPAVQHLNGLEPDDQFLNDDNTAMTISGPWLFNHAQPDLLPKIGVALPPGSPFVGGSHLVIWKHSARSDSALKLIRFLLQTPAQVAYSQHVGLLPAQPNALTAPPFSTDPFWQLAIEGLKKGRSFPVTRSWGLMEDRLTTALSGIWKEILNNPHTDLGTLIAKQLDPLAKRLDLVLGHS